MKIRLSVSDVADAAVHEVIRHGVYRFNEPHAGPANRQHLSVTIRDPDTGAAIGGFWGETGRGWMVTEWLFVPEQLRGSGLGRQVMQAAEEEALRRGCIGARVETYSFQARGFYEKCGYSVFGMIENNPPGHRRYFLQKRLTGRLGRDVLEG